MVKRFPSNMVARQDMPEQWPNLKTGEYAFPGLLPTATGTVSLTANTAVVYPMFLPVPIGIVQASVMLTTGQTSATGKLALYEWDHINRTVLDVVEETTTAFNIAAAQQGVVDCGTDFDALVLEQGWYAWAFVSNTSSVALRYVSGVDPMVMGAVNANSTAWEHATHYTFDATGVIAGTFSDDETVTAVESNSDFAARQIVALDFSLNPAV